jgi:hypothetical protein
VQSIPHHLYLLLSNDEIFQSTPKSTTPFTANLSSARGRTFLKFVNYTVTLRPDKVQFHFANLFNGDGPPRRRDQPSDERNWDVVSTDVQRGLREELRTDLQGPGQQGLHQGTPQRHLLGVGNGPSIVVPKI